MYTHTGIRCTLFLLVLIYASNIPVDGHPGAKTEERSGQGASEKRGGEGTQAGCFPSSPALPDTTGPKNRTLGIIVGDPGRKQAIRIRFVDLPRPYDGWNGATMWAAIPERGNEFFGGPFGGAFFNASILSCTPAFAAWSELVGSCAPFPGRCFSSANLGGGCSSNDDCVPAVVYLFHEGVIPDARYELQVIDSSCDPDNENDYSLPLVLTTSRWGDVVSDCSARPCGQPNGSVEISDILATLLAFAGVPDAMIRARAELEPACQDFVMNISDTLRCIGAFQGLPYPFEPSSDDPCNSPCRVPFP